MMREEILKKIEEVEKAMFYLEMKDGWSAEDFWAKARYENNIKELKAQLEKIDK